MKRFFITIFLFVFSNKLFAQQNLVVNPSFEEKTACNPKIYNSGDFYYFPIVIPFYKFDTMYRKGWTDPTNRISMLLDSLCSPTTFHARTGGCSARICLCEDSSVIVGNRLAHNDDSIHHNYVQGTLSKTLQKGHYYCVSFWSIAENSIYTTNSIGLKLTDTLMYQSDTNSTVNDLCFFNPDFEMQSSKYLSYYPNFQQISIIYKAKGTERFFIIGNFKKFKDMQIIQQFPIPNYTDKSVIALIDDVSVTELPQNLITGDTAWCVGQSSGVLTANNDFYQFQWSTGQFTQSITINNVGKYWCKMTNDCGTITDTIEVKYINPPQNFSLGNNSLICNNQYITLTAPANYSYLWNTGEQTQSIQVNQAGIYTCTISNICGTATSSITVVNGNTPNTNPLIKGETNLCENGVEVSKILSTDSPYELLWSNGAQSKSIIISEPGEYWLKEKNECGEHTEKVTAIGCIPFLVFPTAFSPNQDGKNDEFKPITKYVDDLQYSIYNRYGNCVFTNDNALFGWDGKYKTIDCPIGTYFYICKYKINNQEKIVKGDFELVR